MLDDHIDLAVRIRVLPDSALVAARIGSVRRVVCGSPGYFSARGVPKAPGAFIDYAAPRLRARLAAVPLNLGK